MNGIWEYKIVGSRKCYIQMSRNKQKKKKRTLFNHGNFFILWLQRGTNLCWDVEAMCLRQWKKQRVFTFSLLSWGEDLCFAFFFFSFFTFFISTLCIALTVHCVKITLNLQKLLIFTILDWFFFFFFQRLSKHHDYQKKKKNNLPNQ